MGTQKTQLSKVITQNLTCGLQRMITWYQKLRPQSVGAQCRFVPSCSCYAHDALDKDGLKALPRIAWRLMRCNPLNKNTIQLDPYHKKDKSHELTQ